MALLAEGETLNPDFLGTLRAPHSCARDIMVGPVIAVDEDTDIAVIARLLTTHHIKRVPVLRDGRVVGIVSRVDLVRALAEEQPEPAHIAESGVLAEAVAARSTVQFPIGRPACAARRRKSTCVGSGI